MTRLFVQFYLGVVVILAVAWAIYTYQVRTSGIAPADDEMAQLMERAFGGGARLAREYIEAASDDEDRQQRLKHINDLFDYPVALIPQKKVSVPGLLAFSHNAKNTKMHFPRSSASKRATERLNRESALQEKNRRTAELVYAEALKNLQPEIDRWTAEISQNIDKPATDPTYHPLKFVNGAADNDVVITGHDDGTVVASGANPDKTNYTLEFELPMVPLTGLRLEALSDDSLPGHGPGRAKNGNFVLSRLTASLVDVADSNKEKPQRLTTAESDFAQRRYPAKKALTKGYKKDGTRAGWSVGPRYGENHSLTAFFRRPLAGPGQKLKIALEFHFGERHTLGRFRMSGVSGTNPSRGLPEPVATSIRKSAAERSNADTREIADYVASLHEPTAVLQARIAELKRTATLIPMVNKDIVAKVQENLISYSTPLSGGKGVLHFGFLPMDITPSRQTFAVIKMGIVLLIAGVAIALLLRPVAVQLQSLETAALAISGGEFGARVPEDRTSGIAGLAQAFNGMADRVEKLMQTQRELLQVVSHELRTPLARIHFAIDLIRVADTPEERQTRVDTLNRSATELDDLVNELLQYLQIETGLLEVHREELPLRATTQELYDELVPQNPHLKMDFGADLSQTELIAVLDQRRTRRVLRNIIANATRFAASHIQLNAVINDGDLLIHIDDDGPGIREEDRARIFEPFFRSATNGGSAGLGLALVYHFLTSVGGHVTVTDSPLGGARFVLDVPQKRNGLYLHPASESKEVIPGITSF